MGFGHYEPEVMDRIADQVVGFRVDTGNLDTNTYLDGASQFEIFNVFGVIKVNQLFAEATVVWGAGLCTMILNFTGLTPIATGPDPIAATTGAILAALPLGQRLVHIGGEIALPNTPTIGTGTAGISDVLCANPQILGQEGGTGTIGHVTAAAAIASGSHQWSIFYEPMSDGAYVTNVV